MKQLGFFAPYRYAAETQSPENYPALEMMIAQERPRFEAILAQAETYLPTLADLTRAPRPHPRWAQDWFPRLDALAAYTFIRMLKPRRVVEIGAGHSTRFMALAAMDEAAGTQIDVIDPAPRADLSAYAGVTVHRHVLREALPKFWETLEAGDIVSLDGSHLLMPGTDVDIFLGDVLPRLAGRAILHIHDIFLPDAYPKDWGWRGYNEQSAIAGLLASGAFDILWSGRYVATRMAALLGSSPIAQLPRNEGTYETSLWLAPKALNVGSRFGSDHSEKLQRAGPAE